MNALLTLYLPLKDGDTYLYGDIHGHMAITLFLVASPLGA